MKTSKPRIPESDKEFVAQNYKQMSYADIATALNRTKGSIKGIVKSLDIREPRADIVFSPRMVEIIQERYAETDTATLAKELGVTQEQLVAKANSIGVCKRTLKAIDTPQLRKYILSNWGKISVPDMAKAQDKSTSQLHRIIQTMRDEGIYIEARRGKGRKHTKTIGRRRIKGVMRDFYKTPDGKWHCKPLKDRVPPAKGDRRTRKIDGEYREQIFTGEKWIIANRKRLGRLHTPIGYKKKVIVGGKEREYIMTEDGWRIVPLPGSKPRPKARHVFPSDMSVDTDVLVRSRKIKSTTATGTIGKKKKAKAPKIEKPKVVRPPRHQPKKEVQRFKTIDRTGQEVIPIEVPRLKLHIQCRPENLDAKVAYYREKGYEVNILPKTTLAA